MPRFKVGDRVERIGVLIPPYMKNGVVRGVVQNKDGIEWLTEYEVDFGQQLIAAFYESQLRLVKPAADD